MPYDAGIFFNSSCRKFPSGYRELTVFRAWCFWARGKWGERGNWGNQRCRRYWRWPRARVSTWSCGVGITKMGLCLLGLVRQIMIVPITRMGLCLLDLVRIVPITRMDLCLLDLVRQIMIVQITRCSWIPRIMPDYLSIHPLVASSIARPEEVLL